MLAGITSNARSFVARWPLTSYGIAVIAFWLILILVRLSVQAFGEDLSGYGSRGSTLSLILITMSVFALPFAPLAVAIETFLPDTKPVVGIVLTASLGMVLCWVGDKTIVRVRKSLPGSTERRLFLKRWTLILGAMTVFAVGVLFSPFMRTGSHYGCVFLAFVTQLAGIGFLIGLIVLITTDWTADECITPRNGEAE